MRLGDVGAPGNRDEVREVMSRPEFQYPKSLMERVGDAIGDRLDGVFQNASIGGPSTFSGGLGTLIGWVILALAVAAVVVLVVLVVRRWVPSRRRRSERPTEAEIEHRKPASDWSREATDHESRGEWKLAIRARFRELVRMLVDRAQVADLPGRTTGELLEDIRLTTPDAVDSFHTACILFELPWYADQPTGEQQNHQMRAAMSAVLAAPVLTKVTNNAMPAVGRGLVGNPTVELEGTDG